MNLSYVEQLANLFNIDDARMWNLEETGGTPGRDVTSVWEQRRYMHCRGTTNYQFPEFDQKSRATHILVVNALGDVVYPCLCSSAKTALKSKAIRQKYCLRLVFFVFTSWCRHRDAQRQRLCRNWQLIPVGWHVPLTVSEILLNAVVRRYLRMVRTERNVTALYEGFKENGVAVYALPAHMSEKAQPCAVVLFGAHERVLNHAPI